MLARGEVFPSTMEQAFDRFVCRIINCEFDSAFQIADSFSSADTTDPVGPLLRLLVCGMRDLDFDRTIDSAGFLNTYRTTVKRIAGYEETHGRSSYTMTLAGFANATHAAYYLRQKKYVAAVGTGLDAMKLLHEAKAADSANYDVDLFLGLYEYGKAELRRRLWMVLFWYGGDKHQGIERLRQCAGRARFAGPAARLSLADIYINENRLDSARAVIDELRREYPASRFILWSRAKYLLAAGQRRAAAGVYGELSDSYAAAAYGTYNSLATRRRQIELLCEERAGAEARRIAKKTLAGTCREPAWRHSAPCGEIRKLAEKGGCDGGR